MRTIITILRHDNILDPKTLSSQINCPLFIISSIVKNPTNFVIEDLVETFIDREA